MSAATPGGPGGPPTLPLGLETQRTEGGVEFVDIAVGDGAVVAEGAKVRLHCRGWLTNGTPVEDTREGGEAAEVVLGGGQVPIGFEEGVVGMKVGGTRRLIVPSDLAYGSAGRGPRIPPYATLIYDVEVLGVG